MLTQQDIRPVVVGLPRLCKFKRRRQITQVNMWINKFGGSTLIYENSQDDK
jgi:hypothetical protein